jgi:ABC-type dipeptide/oligopeptide/nickel transport system permease subunit
LVTREGLEFQRKRITGVLNLLVRNRMALVGLSLLVFFIFAAIAAPILSPYGPTIAVSGREAQPEWVSLFPDGYYLSKNIVVVQDPLFNSAGSTEQWTIATSTATLSRLQISYAPGVSDKIASHGSLQMVYSGGAPASVKIFQVFHFPYHGPPESFTATAHWLLSGADASHPVQVRLFVQSPGGQEFNFVNFNETFGGQWRPPSPGDSFLSNDVSVQKTLGTSATGFSPPQIIFSTIGDYAYGLEVKFSGPQQVNIDDAQLSLAGTAFGLMGTDVSGADIWTQFVYGARISLFVGLLSAGIGISLGLLVGLMAGFLGKIVDEVLMRFTDMMLVIPGLPLIIVLIAVIGPGIWNLIIVIGFLGWMGFARIVRSQVLTLRERPFVEAARASGSGPGRIIRVHIMPNIVSLTYVNLALSVPAAILTESALAFLGLSDPTLNSWGHMFEEFNTSGAIARFPPVWWWVLPPGFGIALVSLSFILIGYALDELFNPRLRRRR